MNPENTQTVVVKNKGSKFWLLIFFSLGGLIIGSICGYNQINEGTNSKNEIESFESALRSYLRRETDDLLLVKIHNLPEGLDYNFKNVLSSGASKLSTFSNSYDLPSSLKTVVQALSYKNEKIALSRINYAIKEYNRINGPEFNEFGDRIVKNLPFQPAEFEDWNTTKNWRGIMYGIFWGLIGGSAGWLFVIISNFVISGIWNFFLDRLREISKAIKG